jgi:hypothetical protein
MLQIMYRSPRNTPTLPSTVIDVDRRGNDPGHQRRYGLALLVGAVALAAAPILALEPAVHWSSDPELFRLLRGMAVLKGVMALAGLAVVAWRLRRTISSRMAGSYIAGAWALALASGLIWELQVIPLASTLFHSAVLALLVTAWRDSGSAERTRTH